MMGVEHYHMGSGDVRNFEVIVPFDTIEVSQKERGRWYYMERSCRFHKRCNQIIHTTVTTSPCDYTRHITVLRVQRTPITKLSLVFSIQPGTRPVNFIFRQGWYTSVQWKIRKVTTSISFYVNGLIITVSFTGSGITKRNHFCGMGLYRRRERRVWTNPNTIRREETV